MRHPCLQGLLALRAPAPVVRAPSEKVVPLLREEYQRRDASDVLLRIPRLAERVRTSVLSFPAPADAPVTAHADYQLFTPPPAAHQGLLQGGVALVEDPEAPRHPPRPDLAGPRRAAQSSTAISGSRRRNVRTPTTAKTTVATPT